MLIVLTYEVNKFSEVQKPVTVLVCAVKDALLYILWQFLVIAITQCQSVLIDFTQWNALLVLTDNNTNIQQYILHTHKCTHCYWTLVTIRHTAFQSQLEAV